MGSRAVGVRLRAYRADGQTDRMPRFELKSICERVRGSRGGEYSSYVEIQGNESQSFAFSTATCICSYRFASVDPDPMLCPLRLLHLLNQ